MHTISTSDFLRTLTMSRTGRTCPGIAAARNVAAHESSATRHEAPLAYHQVQVDKCWVPSRLLRPRTVHLQYLWISASVI